MLKTCPEMFMTVKIFSSVTELHLAASKCQLEVVSINYKITVYRTEAWLCLLTRGPEIGL